MCIRDRNLRFNTLLTIISHNRQKRRRRKERTTYGPLRRYSQLVTHSVCNPHRQGLTWAPELKLNFSGRNSFFGEIFCLEYPIRRNEKVNCHFVNYRFSFRKLQILISQTTDFHFVSFHFVSFHFVSLHFVSQTIVSLCSLRSRRRKR